MSRLDNTILAACNIFCQYRETFCEFPESGENESDFLYRSRKRDAVMALEDFVLEHAGEAPVKTLINRFIYKMAVYCATCGRESEAYDLFRLRKETAEEVLIYFL